VYECRCWFALASGYDWSSLGAEGKITWMVITNNLDLENKINSVQRSDFSWSIFGLCGYKENLKKLGKFVLIV
jgi:hypothetical protein